MGWHTLGLKGGAHVPLLLSSVHMPPIASVKNSSMEGPTPSSIGRTDLERHTPAK
jgi:hypothetical protein